jgi:hypothetical protein
VRARPVTVKVRQTAIPGVRRIEPAAAIRPRRA